MSHKVNGTWTNYQQFSITVSMYIHRSSSIAELSRYIITLSHWIGLRSVLRPRQHSIGYMGDGFYRTKNPTNSIKVRKEQIVHKTNQTYNKQT